LTIYGWCKINPNLGPKGEQSTWRERITSLPEIGLVVLIFLMMIVGLMKGLFTPTEAGSVGTGLVLLLSIVRRDLGFKEFIKSVAESLKTACMVLMLIAGSTILGHFLAVTKIPMIAADWVAGLALNKYVIMVIISLIYQTGGSFIDDLAFMILATPIFYPVILKLGFDPIWFGIVIAITVMIGVVIPPMAMNVFVVKNITKVPFNVIYKGVAPFLISMVVCAALLFVFPQLATYLPNLLMK
jgi:C4-dicarboxylate transporter DctM subunit